MKGFTLIETILYIALFSLLIFGLIDTSYKVLSNLDGYDQTIEGLEDGNFIIGKLDWLLSGAQAIYEPAFNSTSTALRLKNNGHMYMFESSNEEVMYQKDSMDPAPLNNLSIRVTRFVVEHGLSNNEPAWLKVSFAIDSVPFSIVKYTRL